jgi:hypothetical protein
MQSVYKKYLGYNNSSDAKNFTEELVAPKKIQIQNILKNYIPKHAPTEQGKETSTKNPINFYSPSQFNANDADCPVGFQRYVPGSPYSANFKTFHLNRYWKSIAAINIGDIPSVSNKWVDITEEAWLVPLRKRYRLLLEPLDVENPDNYSFKHKPATPFATGTLLANGRLDTLLVNGYANEILPGDNIYIPSINTYLKVVYIDNGNLLYIYKLDPTDELYDPILPNNGLTSLITNGTIFHLYPKQKDYMINLIDFSQDDEKTFTPEVRKTDNTVLPFGLGDYFIDTDIGILTFQEFLPANVTTNISISHYQYVDCAIRPQQYFKLKNVTIFSGSVKELIGDFEINNDRSYLAFKFRGVLGPGLTITLEFFDFEEDITIGQFDIVNNAAITSTVTQVLVIDKFVGKVEIRAIKNLNDITEHLSLTLF